MVIPEGVALLPMPNRANTTSNDDSNAAIKFMFGSGKRPSSHMPVTLGSLSLRRPSMYSGLIRSFSFERWSVKESAHYFEWHEHSWSTDSSVIAPRIAGLHLSTQGLGEPEFQEFEEIQMSCRKISAGERSANLPLKDSSVLVLRGRLVSNLG